MNTTSARHHQILTSLSDKEYRDAVVDAEIDEVIAAQLRQMREMRGWTQKDVGDRAEMAQATVSLLENPNYGKYTLRTLKRLASAFDVALMVRFAPFSELARRMASLSSADLAVPSFKDEADSGLRQLEMSTPILADGTMLSHLPINDGTGLGSVTIAYGTATPQEAYRHNLTSVGIQPLLAGRVAASA